MHHVGLADGALTKTERDPRSDPSARQHGSTAMKVEDVITAEANSGRRRESLRETNHAHVVGVLFDAFISVAEEEMKQQNNLFIKSVCKAGKLCSPSIGQ